MLASICVCVRACAHVCVCVYQRASVYTRTHMNKKTDRDIVYKKERRTEYGLSAQQEQPKRKR